MKKKTGIALLSSVLALSLCFAIAACGENDDGKDNDTGGSGGGNTIEGQTWMVASPDGSLKTELVLDDFGTLHYRVFKDDITVTEYSTLGFTLEEDDLYQMLSYVDSSERTVDVTYENITGKHEEVRANCNERTISLQGGTFNLDVIVRSYDDGYAFRYIIKAIDGSEGTFHVMDERSEFALPEGSVTWQQPYKSNLPSYGKGNFFSYEEQYTRRSAKNLYGRQISMPMLYKAGDSDVYSLITESALIGSGFYGSFLAEDEANEGAGILRTVPSPAGGMSDETANVVAYPFTSPWRVGITGSLGDVVESELVEKVYDDAEYWKPDDYDTLSAEEQAVYDYSWVEPGLVAWDWLRAGNGTNQQNYTMHREYLQLAADMGWKYIILDGGWEPSFNSANFSSFMRAADEKGVKVIVWCNAIADFGGSVTTLRNKLRSWSEAGIVGIKIDFFDGQNATNPKFYGEDIDTIKWYETIYQECAKLKMIVNCHGANKPTGERRVYPNVVNREAIHGNEMTSVSSSFTVNSLFVRMGIGPTDFTPVVKPYNNGKGLTMAQQLALAVLYESGTPSMAGVVSEYTDPTVNDFFMELRASAWSDMKFLCGELDGYFVAAVKMGEDWYVAGANGITEREASFSLSFLDAGSYHATLWTDHAGDPTQVNRTEQTVSCTDTLSIALEKNGGFVVRITKS